MNKIEELDINLLEGYLDSLGQDIVQQMLDLYIQQSVTYSIEISDAIDRESQDLWQERCHKMKGATGSVGMVDAHKKLVAIEKIMDSWQEKKMYLSELIEINESAIDAFRTWLSVK